MVKKIRKTIERIKICLNCGKSFKKPYKYSRNQWDQRKYCSSKCIKKTGKIIKCKKCNKDFYIFRHRLKERKYCSRKCYWEDLKIRMKGKKNPFYQKTHTLEVRQKLKAMFIGRKLTDSTKRKMSESRKKEWASGKRDFEKIRKKLLSKEAIARGAISRMGKNNPAWKGGISKEPYAFEFNKELKEQIRQRDNHTCQECNHTEKQLTYKLRTHHIDYDKKNNDPKNLISLCKSCHSKTNFNREYWMNYFQEKLKDLKK